MNEVNLAASCLIDLRPHTSNSHNKWFMERSLILTNAPIQFLNKLRLWHLIWPQRRLHLSWLWKQGFSSEMAVGLTQRRLDCSSSDGPGSKVASSGPEDGKTLGGDAPLWFGSTQPSRCALVPPEISSNPATLCLILGEGRRVFLKEVPSPAHKAPIQPHLPNTKCRDNISLSLRHTEKVTTPGGWLSFPLKNKQN